MTESSLGPTRPEDLATLLTLSNAGGARTTEDIFIGASHWMVGGRVFGGQILGQSLMAASRTVPAERIVHSMHAYFLRAGDIHLPVTFAVDRLRDGNSFSSRRINAYQNGEPILSVMASFQEHNPGLEHTSVEMPADLPAPETLVSSLDIVGKAGEDFRNNWSQYHAIDIRHVGSPVFFSVTGERTASQAIWFRAVEPLSPAQHVQRAALAYASDHTILEPILRRHGIAWLHPGMRTASLDHAMWFHRDVQIDQWLLYVQTSPSAQGGRGLSTAHIFQQDGTLVATVAQEGMVRVPEIR